MGKKLHPAKRREMIEHLIDDDFNTIVEGNETAYLYDILRTGHKGYENFTNKELIEEHKDRFAPYV